VFAAIQIKNIPGLDRVGGEAVHVGRRRAKSMASEASREAIYHLRPVIVRSTNETGTR
jgi:hypothetical protein